MGLQTSQGDQKFTASANLNQEFGAVGVGMMNNVGDETQLSLGFKNNYLTGSNQLPQESNINLTDFAGRPKSQPNLMRMKTANQRKNLNPAEYLQRRKRRGLPPEISAFSVTNAVFNIPAINKTKPVASLFQGKSNQPWRSNPSTMSHKYLTTGIEGTNRRNKVTIKTSSNMIFSGIGTAG